MSGGDSGRSPDGSGPDLLDGGSGSLLDAVDTLLDRGALVTGDLVLGLADVDLIYLRLSTLLAAADRVMGRPPREPGTPEGRTGDGAPERGAPGGGAPQGSSGSEAPAPAPERPGELDTLRHELERTLGEPSARPGDSGDGTGPAPAEGRAPRWNADPEDVERSVARLVLALVEFLRKLMERQAIRRMEEGSLTEGEVERLGRALMRLEETVHDLADRFGIPPKDLTLDLGPLGTLS